ncbi:MAG: DUF4845 domain-containing protein [Gammaproteobacteria bacterium]|nr:DUF4845 domain-containing protein [Gammaproteobacteria bacterium]
MKKQTLNKQKGMTLISWVIVIAFVGFHFMLAIRIVPVFAEDHTISTFWKNLENDIALVGATPAKIRSAMMKKFRINNISALKQEDIKVKKSGDHYLVTAEYEPRGKIIGPLDFIVSFKHEAKIRAR